MTRRELQTLFKHTSVTENGCRLWTGYRRPDGYARVRRNGRLILVHRLAYELTVGPIPAGMELDHLCHTRDLSCVGGRRCAHRACLEVTHLQVVTGSENTRRRSARIDRCPSGHAFDMVDSRGTRCCRTCVRKSAREYARRRRAMAS